MYQYIKLAVAKLPMQLKITAWRLKFPSQVPFLSTAYLSSLLYTQRSSSGALCTLDQQREAHVCKIVSAIAGFKALFRMMLTLMHDTRGVTL